MFFRKCIHLVVVIYKTWQSRYLFMCWQNRYHYLFPWEVLTNLWGIKGHIRSGREILSSRDSEVKIFKNIFLPQGWYNWWCIFYRSLIDEIFLKCLFCISCLYCEPFQRLTGYVKWGNTLHLYFCCTLIHIRWVKTFTFKEFATFMSFRKDTLRRRFSTKHF